MGVPGGALVARSGGQWYILAGRNSLGSHVGSVRLEWVVLYRRFLRGGLCSHCRSWPCQQSRIGTWNWLQDSPTCTIPRQCSAARPHVIWWHSVLVCLCPLLELTTLSKLPSTSLTRTMCTPFGPCREKLSRSCRTFGAFNSCCESWWKTLSSCAGSASAAHIFSAT